MKIFHVTEVFTPFVGYQEILLAQEQIRCGHDVTILARNFRSAAEPEYAGSNSNNKTISPGRTKEAGIDIYRVPAVHIVGRAWLKGIANVLDELKPDVIHCHAVMQYFSQCVAWYKKRHPSVRLVYDSHNQGTRIHNELPHRIGRWIGAKILGLLESKDICYVGITSECCRLMIDVYKVPPERVYMIPLATDHLWYCPDPQRRNAFRRKLGLDDKDYLVVNTGKILPAKRLDILAKAIAITRPKVPTIKMIQIGGGSKEHAQMIERTIEQLHVEDVVTMVPAVDHRDLADYYRAADICVWPGTVTTSMIDAAGCGTALVVTAAEGVEYQVSNDNAIVCRDKAEAEELADAIIALCLDDSRRLTLGRRGRELAEKRLNWQEVAKGFQELYEGRFDNQYRWHESQITLSETRCDIPRRHD